MLTLDSFETQINATILQQGRDYFKQQAVESLEEDPPGTWLAVVEGSEDYEITVQLAGRNITATSCDCPYDGGTCKHLVAMLFALREQAATGLPIKKTAKSAGKLSFEETAFEGKFGRNARLRAAVAGPRLRVWAKIHAIFCGKRPDTGCFGEVRGTGPANRPQAFEQGLHGLSADEFF